MHSFPLLLLLTIFLTSSFAEETRTETVTFAKGYDSAVVTGKITAEESVLYELNAREGQFLTVSLRPDNKSANFNIYIPGKGPGEDALFASAAGGTEYTGQLYKSGVHTVSVFLVRSAARRGEAANFDIAFRISDEKPSGPIPAEIGPAVMKPATGDLPVVDAPAVSPWEKVSQATSDHAPLLERQAGIPRAVAVTPVSITTLVLEEGLLGYVTEISAKYDTMEEPSEVDVTVIEGGILDDDLHGIRHVVTLLRNRNNQWRVTGYTRGELRRHHFK